MIVIGSGVVREVLRCGVFFDEDNGFAHSETALSHEGCWVARFQ